MASIFFMAAEVSLFARESFSNALERDRRRNEFTFGAWSIAPVPGRRHGRAAAARRELLTTLIFLLAP
jgi:hypothetical protein